jgi:mono/diheme cytochrome c family protein
MAIERIEVFLDHGAEPVQVLKQAPFKVRFDTRSLSDGEHLFKVVTRYTNGSSEVKEIPFKVANTPGVLVEGLQDGKEVSGDLEVGLRVADPQVRSTVAPFPALGAVVTTALLLGAIWAFFALNKPAGNRILEEVGKPAAVAEGDGGGAVVEAAMKKGGEVYTGGCAGCHGANGEGGFGPVLAGDASLSDATMVLTVIKKGRGNMPAVGATLSPEDLAAVSTYVRNSWGNAYGGVSVDEAKAIN